jgi:ribosomal protein L7/L12
VGTTLKASIRWPFVLSSDQSVKTVVRERKHSDLLLNAVIKQVLQKTEFDYIVKRADEDADPGMIGDRVISDIINAELVVADLTDLNPNAFYELGIRHSTEKPAIHVARAGTALPFDNVAHRTIFVDLTDWHSIEQARERLASSARTIRTPDYKVSNPITQANASFKMRQSEDPRDQVIAQIQERMAALETAFPMRSMAIEYDAQKDVREIATALEKNEIKRAISLYRGLTGADLVQSKSFIEAVKNGRKIDSIKIHRTVTSDSLREAKDFVDILAGER